MAATASNSDPEMAAAAAGSSSNDSVDLVRSHIQQHLRERGIFDDLRLIVSNALGTSGDPGAHTAERRAVRQGLADTLQGRAAPHIPDDTEVDFALQCELLGGRAFFDARDTRGKGMLRVSLQLGEARLETVPTPFCSEPALAGCFRFPLPLADAADADAGEQLLRCRQPMHLLLLESRPDGSDELVSSLLVEWRKVLQVGRCTLSIELPGIDPQSKMPIGCLELRLALLAPAGAAVPELMAEQEVTKNIR